MHKETSISCVNQCLFTQSSYHGWRCFETWLIFW